MEKYAVDLEKVLDDFEYKEKHLHKYSSDQRVLDDSFSCNYNINENVFPRAYRTPAANYRRPPFEPMNLADADFSVSARSQSHCMVQTNDAPIDHYADFDQSNKPLEQSDSEFIPPVQHSAPIDYSFAFNLKDKNDYKPDLIESNTEICLNSDGFGRIERNLPDIASASVFSKEEEMLAHTDIDIDEDEQLLPVTRTVSSKKVCIEAVEGENSSSMSVTTTNVKPKVISFQISNNVTDDVLHQYLEELVESDNAHSQSDGLVSNSDHSLHTDDVVEEITEITEDGSYSITELDDGVGNETECSSSENFEAAHKSNCSSSESDNREYRILSDNVLLISSSVESQDNLECDVSENSVKDNALASSNDSKFVDATESNAVKILSLSEHANDSGSSLNYEIHENSTVFENEENSLDHPSDTSDFAQKTTPEDVGSEGKGTFERMRDKRQVEIEDIEPESHKLTSNMDAELVFNQVENDSDDLAAVSDDAIVEYGNSILTNFNQIAIHEENTTFSTNPNQHFQTSNSKMGTLNLDYDNVVSDTKTNTVDETFSSVSKRYADTPRLASDMNDDDDDDKNNHHYQNAELDDGESENGQLFTKAKINTDVKSTENLASTSQAKPPRPDFLDLTQNIQNTDMSSTSADSGSLLSVEERKLGKEPPYWIPDSDTTVCMHCQLKFNPVLRRRHHCRACGLVVCAKCSDKKASLEYLGFKEDRVCHTCHSILQKINNVESDSSSIMKRPNPNNPMEYCSKIPPLLQVGSSHHPTPSVLVPKVGVLKREGRAKTNDAPKQVIFSDGIRPGGDLTELDASPEPRLPLRRSSRVTKRVGTPPGITAVHRRLLNPDTRSFIPSGADLPPVMTKIQGEYNFSELETPLSIEDDAVKFAINRNLFVVVSRLILDCCVHKEVWCVATEGLSCVGQDEIVFIIEVLPEEKHPPKDVFSTINTLYQDASKGSTITEMSYVAPCTNQLFGTKEHGGFIFIRPTYQCLQKLKLPKPPFLIALLIHRWETPWARLFPIRLVLRLGAEYRYYPCPLVSVRNRPALYSEIGHTIFTLLADFRKYTYTLPTVRGLMIHMEDRLTTILLPKNRYDQIIRALNNSEENVLAFAGNISTIADSHLVCIQSTQQEDTAYQTQAINILNKPRQVTGASFVVFNGSQKQCGWSGKSNIVEDGLMVQIPSESMAALRNALRQMKNYSIGCGPQAEEMVVLKWAPDDVNFNIGVKSEIDSRALDGIPSIRVHNGTDYSGILRLIRWTEVFIIQSDEESNSRTSDSVNISKLSESIAKSTCVALLPLLDLLATANLTTIAVRVTIHPENVGYEAGSKGEKLPPIYMKSLDEELIAVINKATVSIGDVINPIVLELIFKIMEQG